MPARARLFYELSGRESLKARVSRRAFETSVRASGRAVSIKDRRKEVHRARSRPRVSNERARARARESPFLGAHAGLSGNALSQRGTLLSRVSSLRTLRRARARVYFRIRSP